ncbi:hypothetical protein GCM10010840_12560 [Deinococcus aerolatus]|uniref:Outer membrane protein beta-barrel domain-containing protein n=1 Tax=Deinococcus aerolatus TaxID=522487 RepID=A0ABQ2G538_9DEIO|nr:hypothetical protein [Deinococcus aerolatus]GGL75922.1 hypothetical protein GCM10010840_12560 [Deinococcus aerolatus]
MNPRFLLMAAVLALPCSASAATAWAGVDATTKGYGVHAGGSVFRVPVLGTLGLEGAAEKAWRRTSSNRFAVGATLRDINLPITRVDAFAAAGAEYTDRFGVYAEGGVRGPLLGPAGWRAFVRSGTASGLGAGVGVELRF